MSNYPGGVRVAPTQAEILQANKAIASFFKWSWHILSFLFLGPLLGLYRTRPQAVWLASKREAAIGYRPWVAVLAMLIWGASSGFVLTAFPWLTLLGGLALAGIALPRSIAAKVGEGLSLRELTHGVTQLPKLLWIIPSAITALTLIQVVVSSLNGNGGGSGTAAALTATAAVAVTMGAVGHRAMELRRTADEDRDAVLGVVAYGLNCTEDVARELRVSTGVEDGLHRIQVQGFRAEQSRTLEQINQRFAAMAQPWGATTADLAVIVLMELTPEQVAARQALAEESSLVAGFEALDEQPGLDAGGF
jgi:hypothetical protein